MKVTYYNRGIKTWRTIKTKLPLQFCLIGLTIMIGQLGGVGQIGKWEESM